MMTSTTDSIKQARQIFSQQTTDSILSGVRIADSTVLPPIEAITAKEDLQKRKQEQELVQQDQRFEAEMQQRKIDRELKQSIATLVFRFLAVETLAVFVVVLIQGFRPGGFHLDDSTINIFLGATLLQISTMAVIITRHLYPN